MINKTYGGHIQRIVIGISALVLLMAGGASSPSAAPYAYVANFGSNNVSVIDTATNTVTATVNVGNSPDGLAINPAGTRVYVVNTYSHNVSVIDTATNTVTATVNVGYYPRAVAADEINAYVANTGGSNVSVIDIATNTVTASVKVGLYPIGVAVNPAGTRVYVTNSQGDTVSVINTTTNTVITSVKVGDGPRGVAVNPAGTRVYVTKFSDSHNVSVIDTATNTVTATVNVGNSPDGLAINPAGTRVYVTNSQGDTVSVINTTTNTVITSVKVGDYPNGLAINPAGTRVYVSNLGSNNVSVIDTATNTVTASVNVGSEPQGVAVNPAGTPTPTTPTPTPPTQLPPEIVRVETFREGDMVFFRLFFTDPNDDAEGFGFRGAKGSGWAEETHPLSSPSYGRVSPGQIEYPFNHLCETGPAQESDVEAWIYDSAGLISPSVTVHLACDAPTETIPTITVISPNGGENWQADSTQTIKWSYTGNPGADVKIELFKPGKVNQIIESKYSIGSKSTGAYNWKIPSNQASGTDNKIVITSTTNSAYKDTSNRDFSIQALPTTGIGEIRGTVFDDFNGDGVKNSDALHAEPGLKGWTVNLMRVTDRLSFPTTTNKYGQYVFKNVPAGDYIVREIVNTGWTPVFVPAPVPVPGEPVRDSEGYTLTIPDKQKTKMTGIDFGNNPSKGQKRPNTFYAGIDWKSDAIDVPQQAYAFDAGLVSSYADTNWATGAAHVYVAYNNIPTEKNYIKKPKGDGTYKIAFSHSGGTQTLMKKLQSGAVKAEYAVFVAPALINQTEVENLVDPINPHRVNKVIIVESDQDVLYNLRAEFKPNPLSNNIYAPFLIPLETPDNIPRIIKGKHIPVAWLLKIINVDQLPEDETFWAGGADRTKQTLFNDTDITKKSANVKVIELYEKKNGKMDNRDVHHLLLVKTIEKFLNRDYPFDGTVDSGLKDTR